MVSASLGQTRADALPRPMPMVAKTITKGPIIHKVQSVTGVLAPAGTHGGKKTIHGETKVSSPG